MANTIRIKRRAVGSGVGAPSSLANAELAFNEDGQILYYGLGTGGSGGSATSVIAIGGAGAFVSSATVRNANTVLAGPASGDAAAPTFRSLVAGDIPSITAAKVSDFDTQVRTNRLDQLAAPTGSVSLNSQKITSLATPTADTDAATKAYVDASRSGLDVKQSVRAASTAAITVTYSATGGTSARGQITEAPSSIDSVNLVQGNRILLKDQSNGAQNGIWVVSTLGSGSNGIWDRATDFDEDTEVTSGAFVFVEEGTTNADSGWVLTTDGSITIGGSSGTALVFAQFSGAGQITAGAGLTKSGNTINVGGTTDRVTVNADSIDIASSYVGQTSITTLGTISSGTWNGGTISVSYGGTGVTTITGIIKGNGTSAFSAATAGTDYLSPDSNIDGGTF